MSTDLRPSIRNLAILDYENRPNAMRLGGMRARENNDNDDNHKIMMMTLILLVLLY